MRRPAQTLSPSWVLWPKAGRDTLLLLAAIAATLLVFRMAPALDVAPSDAFFAPGLGFTVGEDPFWRGVREVFYHLPRWLILGVWLWFGWTFYRPPARPLGVARPALASISAFLGPLLVVNWTLKEFWGRPRPFKTVQFGGEEAYLAPGSIGEACATNCSFVSGEAAAAFWTIWLVVLLPARWRKPAAAAIVAVATLVSVLRIAFGRHYVSDVTVGGLIGVVSVTGVAWALQSGRGRAWVAACVNRRRG